MQGQEWDRSGTIVETHPFRQYSVKMDGSGRVSLRNRRYLQCIDANKSSGLPLTSNKPSKKTNDTPDLPSNRNLTQDGTTTGIPETTTDKEANKEIEELPASDMLNVPQSDSTSEIQEGSKEWTQICHAMIFAAMIFLWT